MEKASGGWWKIAIVITLLVVLIREFMVRMIGITQSSIVIFNEKPLFDLQTIHAVVRTAGEIAGAVVILVMSVFLFHRKRNEGQISAKHARLGTLIGMIGLASMGVSADILWWMIAVGIITAGCGFLVGMEKITTGGMHLGYGMIFGATVIVLIKYGFAIGGGLLFCAVVIGFITGGVGWFFGLTANYSVEKIRNWNKGKPDDKEKIPYEEGV